MRGSCLCGTVRYEARGREIAFDFDHCSRCRKSSGSAFKAELIVKSGELHWLAGESVLKIYEAPVRETAPGYRRAFCAVCGGPVPTVDEGLINIPAGTLDDDPGVRPQRHIFVAGKAPWFEITDNLPRFPQKS